MHTRIAGGCLYHASVALGKPINITEKDDRINTIVFFMVGEDGFEPSKRNATDLQSAPFGHSGTPPYTNHMELVDGFEPPTC